LTNIGDSTDALEHLRGSALGFGNLTTYIARWKPAASDPTYTLDREEPSKPDP
jgi:hypothetical protein